MKKSELNDALLNQAFAHRDHLLRCDSTWTRVQKVETYFLDNQFSLQVLTQTSEAKKTAFAYVSISPPSKEIEDIVYKAFKEKFRVRFPDSIETHLWDSLVCNCDC